MNPLADTTYVLPIRRTETGGDEDLAAYLAWLVSLMPVIVVDGSSAGVFAWHAAHLPPGALHVAIDADRRRDLNGKVAGVVTAMRRVWTPKAIVADDDVRYDLRTLGRLSAMLDQDDVVLPQNVFAPLPWHALLDTGRTLIARATGGDWSGTLGLRTAAFPCEAGYAGNVLFENLELVRTLRVSGATERRADDLFVRRRPPSVRHYLRQRLRQAYDEFARPQRMCVQLAIAPLLALALWLCGPAAAAGAAAGAIVLAETGRRHKAGRTVFSPLASLLAPVWVAERAVTVWAALVARLLRGGVRYSHGTLRIAANATSVLHARLSTEHGFGAEGGAR